MERNRGGMETSVKPKLECIPIPEPRQNIEVAAGEKGVVWEENASGGFKIFIERVSATRGDNNLGNDNTYIDFIVDGVLIERIRREITLNLPDKFKPEIVVRNKVVFRAHNGDDESHQFEVIVQGRMCRPSRV